MWTITIVWWYLLVAGVAIFYMMYSCKTWGSALGGNAGFFLRWGDEGFFKRIGILLVTLPGMVCGRLVWLPFQIFPKAWDDGTKQPASTASVR